MSQLTLHQALNKLFSSERDDLLLEACLSHPDLENFLKVNQLNLSIQSLAHALTHASFSHEYQVPHQELAEFFGDAVLQLIVTQELMRLYPLEKEGRLSKLRSTIVNEKTLAIVAKSLNLQHLIFVGKGEFKKNTQSQDTVLSDSLEALIAKIYQFNGLEDTSEKFLGWLKVALPQAFDLDQLEQFDAKSRLQERTLAKYKSLPRYLSEEISQGFKVQLWINEKLQAEGQFNSKKNGERELAQQVLIKNEF